MVLSRNRYGNWPIRITAVAVPMGVGDRFFKSKSNGKNQLLAEILQRNAFEDKGPGGLDNLRQRASEGTHQTLIA